MQLLSLKTIFINPKASFAEGGKLELFLIQLILWADYRP